MPEAISPRTAQLLKDLTGETHLDAAVLLTLEDALAHKLEALDGELDEFEERYGMDWEAFKEAWDADEVEQKHSLDVERDYWRWEELVTRKARIQDALTWIP